MTKIFVIGNGFDLDHGLPTKYCDFFRYLSSFPEGQIFIDAIEKFSCNYTQELWSNFEEELGYLSVDTVMEEATSRKEEFNSEFDYGPLDDSHITNFLYDDYYSALGFLDDYVGQWARLIDISNINKKDIYEKIFDRNSVFITFNYTKVLEYIYGIDNENILHIHGDVSNEPIMGHGRDHISYMDVNIGDLFEEEFRRNIFSGFSEFYNSSIKDTSSFIKKLKFFLEDHYENVEEITIIGHSLGKVDAPYFEFIRDYFDEARINVLYYDIEDYNRKKISLKGLKFKNFKLVKELKEWTPCE